MRFVQVDGSEQYIVPMVRRRSTVRFRRGLRSSKPSFEIDIISICRFADLDCRVGAKWYSGSLVRKPWGSGVPASLPSTLRPPCHAPPRRSLLDLDHATAHTALAGRG